jgi:hypothetical protein
MEQEWESWGSDEDSTGGFTSRRIATAAHEVITPDGTVIGWAVDEKWAAAIVSGLNEMLLTGDEVLSSRKAVVSEPGFAVPAITFVHLDGDDFVPARSHCADDLTEHAGVRHQNLPRRSEHGRQD